MAGRFAAVRYNDVLGAGMRSRRRKLVEVHRRGASSAAATATAVARSTFDSQRGLRQIIPGRRGRPSTEGRFSSHIRYGVSNRGLVELDLAHLRKAAPYWFIQEVGTRSGAVKVNPLEGPRAELAERSGMKVNVEVPGGNSVKSQVGRVLRRGLVWSGRQYGTDQIIPVSELRDRTGPLPLMRQVTIRREIQGKHYIREGSNAGANQYVAALKAPVHDLFRWHHPAPRMKPSG